MQSDERLLALIRRGNDGAFEVLVARYHARLLAFCRHMVGTREDAEDVLQEVMAAAYNALMADDRPINVRPWLYRIARNRSLNHLRKATAVGVDSMDIHFSEHGASTADKASKREEFRLLVADIQDLPEMQRTALVLREMDALSYEQIAEAMETTVPSVKSLLVRARVGLAEAAEARALTCDEVRDELGEIAEGLTRKMSPAVRRHLKTCKRCEIFRVQLKETNKALAALLPLGPLVLVKKFLLTQLGHHAGSSAGATAASSGATAAGSGAGAGVAGTTVTGGGALAGTSGLVSAGVGAIATKVGAGFAAAALVTAGAVAVDHKGVVHQHHHTVASASVSYGAATPGASQAPSPLPPTRSVAPATGHRQPRAHHLTAVTKGRRHAGRVDRQHAAHKPRPAHTTATPTPTVTTPDVKTPTTATTTATVTAPAVTTPAPGRTQTQTVPTVLPPAPPDGTTTTAGLTPTSSSPVIGTTPPTATSPTTPAPPTTTAPPTSTTPPATTTAPALTPTSTSTTTTAPPATTTAVPPSSATDTTTTDP